MEILYKNRSYAFCLFVGHLILEKALKALIVIATQKQALKIHNLRQLAALAGLQLNTEDTQLISLVNDFNIEARYPEVKREFYKLCTKEYTDQFYKPIITLYKQLCLKAKSKH